MDKANYWCVYYYLYLLFMCVLLQELLDEEKAEMDKLEGLKLDCLTGGTTDLQANSGRIFSFS